MFLVKVVSPAFVHPSIDVGEWYRAVVRLVNLEFSVAVDPGRRLPQRALTFVLQVIDVTVLWWGSGRRRVSGGGAGGEGFATAGRCSVNCEAAHAFP